jgi:hypothetical protein
MNAVVRQGISGKFTKYRLVAITSIACPILAFVVSYFERVIYYANFTRELVPDISFSHAISVGMVRARDSLGEWILWVAAASVIGLVLAVMYVRVKPVLTYTGLLALAVNFLPLVMIAYLFLIAVMLKVGFGAN